MSCEQLLQQQDSAPSLAPEAFRAVALHDSSIFHDHSSIDTPDVFVARRVPMATLVMGKPSLERQCGSSRFVTQSPQNLPSHRGPSPWHFELPRLDFSRRGQRRCQQVSTRGGTGDCGSLRARIRSKHRRLQPLPQNTGIWRGEPTRHCDDEAEIVP